MGPYCQFCNNRCFVERWLPGQGTILLATCPSGMDHDQGETGHTHKTAVNPNDPTVRAYAEAIRENVREQTARRTEVLTLRYAAEAIRGNDTNDIRLSADALLDAYADKPDKWAQVRAAIEETSHSGGGWADPQEAADRWNLEHNIGTPVLYWPGLRIGEGRQSATRSKAWVLDSGAAVVMVEGYAGGIALTHIEEPDHA